MNKQLRLIYAVIEAAYTAGASTEGLGDDLATDVDEMLVDHEELNAAVEALCEEFGIAPP